MQKAFLPIMCLLLTGCSDVDSALEPSPERSPGQFQGVDAQASPTSEPDVVSSAPLDVVSGDEAEGDVSALPSEPSEPSADVMSSPEDGAGPLDEPSSADVAEEVLPGEPETLGGGLLLFELSSEFLNQAGAGARFVDPSEVEASGQAFGPCVATPADPDAPAAPPQWGYDAGVITVSGTTPEVTLSPVDEGEDGTGYVSGLSEELESLFPVGGALLSIKALGGDEIPAFDAYLQVPEAVSISAPSTGLFGSVSSGSDLAVTWNAGNGDSVLVTLTPLSATFQAIAGLSLVCTQDGDLGSLVIPAAALSAVKSSGVTKVAIGVTRIRTSTTNTGGWLVPLVATRSSGGPVGLD